MIEKILGLPKESKINRVELKTLDKKTIFVDQDDSSIWGLMINRCLQKANKKIRKHRFMTISTEINNINVPLAHGIWSVEGASVIANRIIKNNLASGDYSEYVLKDRNTNKKTERGFCFKCDNHVFRHLVRNEVFTKTLNPTKKNEYTILYPRIMGENMNAIDINLYPVKSSIPGFVNLNFIIKNNNRSEAI